MLNVILYLANDTVLDVDYLVCAVGYAALMCYHYYGYALLAVKAAQEFHNLDRCLGIKGAGGLIGQNYLGLGY